MRVSVCCSVLNQSDLLRGMIATVVGQSLKDWELIIVDDGSTEDIKGVIDSFKDERIKYYRFEENKGVPHGINYALAMAVGDYVQPLSADERLELNKFMWQVGYLDDHPEVHGIWGLPFNGELGERPEWEQYQLKSHNRSREAWIRTLMNLESIPIGGASMLWRREVWDDIGLFDPQFYTCSDLELFIRFFKKYNGVVMPYRWVWCEDNPAALHKNVTADSFAKDLAKVRAKHSLDLPVKSGTVTVAMPVRNMQKLIPDAIRSVLNQTYKDLKLVILDDASTDETVKAIQEFDDERIQLLQVTDNIGTESAQNQMLAMCSTPFFMVLCADDTIDETMIEKCIDQFGRDPWLEMVSTQTDFIDEEGNPYTKEHPFKNIRKASNKPQQQWLAEMYPGNHYFGANIYRTQALKDVGGWDTTVSVIGDYDMYLKLLQRENIFVIPENLTHTRIHGANRSLLTPEQSRQLKWDYHKVRAHYYQPRMKVIIATAFYEMRGYSPYIVSMFYTTQLLMSMGIIAEFWEVSGDSYVERAKNTICNKFLEDPDATDLFMIDSDMQWNPESVIQMLQFPEPIVVGSYPQKNSWHKWTSTPKLVEEEGKYHPVGRVLPDGSALIKADFLAGGFLRMKREVLEKYKEKYPDLTYKDMSADPGYPDRIYTEFFACERKDGLRWGEDRVFGKRLAEMGIDIFIYPNIEFGHFGVKGWMGNFDRWLRNPAEQQREGMENTEKVA